MKKNIWSKLIVFVVICMTILNSILPTNIVYAADYGYEYNKKTVSNDGWYIPYVVQSAMGAGSISIKLDGFGEKEGAIYYKDSLGNICFPETNAEGEIYLEKGKEYFVSKVNFGLSLISLGYPVQLVEDKTAEEHPVLYPIIKPSVASPYFNYYLYVKSGDEASLIENIITKLLMAVGACFYGLVCLVIGEEFSIEKVLFNNFGNTKLSFFTNGISDAGLNPFIESSGIKGVLNDFFNFFTGIALAIYLIILVYMAIKIMLGSTAERGSKYKQLLMYWVEGILILFLFPYIMKFSIQINNSFVSFVGANKTSFLAEPVVEAAGEDKKLSDIPEMMEDIQNTIIGAANEKR